MVSLKARLEHTARKVMFPATQRNIWFEEALLAAMAMLFVWRFGAGMGLLAGVALASMAFLALGPSRPVVLLFVGYMATSQEYRSFGVFPFAGVEWHPREILLGMLMLHAGFVALRGQIRVRPDWVAFFILCHLLFYFQIGVIGLINATDIHTVIMETRYPIFLLSYFPFVALLRSRDSVLFYVRVIFWMVLFLAISSIGYFIYCYLTQSFVNIQNAMGSFVPRLFGSVMLESVRPRGHMLYEICIVTLLCLAMAPGYSFFRRLFYVASAGIITVALVIMFMRTALVSLAATLAFALFLMIPNRRAQITLAVLFVVGGIILGLGLGPMAMEIINRRMPEMGTSLEGRFVEIRGAWGVFEEHPVLGAGMGSTFEGMGYAEKSSELAYAQASFQTVHNVWMYYLFKGGMVGTLLIIAGYAILWIRGYLLIPHARDPRERALLLGLVAGLAGQLVASAAMPRLTYPSGYVFLTMLAAAFTLYGFSEKEAEKTVPAAASCDAAPESVRTATGE